MTFRIWCLGLCLVACVQVVAVAQAMDLPKPAEAPKPAKVLIDAPTFEYPARTVSLSPDGKSVLTTNSPFFHESALLRDSNTGAVEQRVSNGRFPAADAIFLDNDRFAVLWVLPLDVEERKKPRQLTIHERKTGVIIHTLTLGFTGTSGDPQISAFMNGDHLVARLDSAEVWDTRTGQKILSITPKFATRQPHGLDRQTTRITDDGTKLILGDNGQWQVFAMVDGKPIGEMVDVGFIAATQFSPDGLSATPGTFPIDGLFDVATGKQRANLTKIDRSGVPTLKPTGQILAQFLSAFSPDGKRWAGQDTNRIYVFDLTGERPQLIQKLIAEGGGARALAWSGDGKRLMSVGALVIGDWDVERGTPWGPPRQHDFSITAIDVAPDGNEFLTADARGKITRWSLPEFKIIAQRPAPQGNYRGTLIDSAMYLSDGKRIITHGADGVYEWLDAETFERQARFETKSGGTWAIHPDGSQIITEWAFNTPRVQLFEPPAEKGIRGIEFDRSLYPQAIKFTPDGKRMLMMTDKSIEMYDLETFKVMRTLQDRPQVPRATVQKLTVSADGKWVFAQADSSVSAWNLADASTTNPTWIVPAEKPVNLSASPGGQLAFICGTSSVQVVELASGQVVASLAMQDSVPRLVRGLPRTSLLAVVSSARRLEAYDLRTALGGAAESLREDSSLHLWEQISGEPREGYAAAIELARRGELLPRIADGLKSMQARREAANQLKALIVQLEDPENAKREAAHLALERQAPEKVANELRAALLTATGEKAERINAILKLGGDNAGEKPAPETNDALRLSRLAEVLSWSTEQADRDAARTLAETVR